MAVGSPLGLLLIVTDAGGVSPISSSTIMAILIPDEVATGAPIRVWAEGMNNSGSVALDASPQLTIWTLDSSGVRSTVVGPIPMTQSGEAYFYDWTPSTSGTYVIQAAGDVAAASVFSSTPVTARPKFDPIALALDGNLVSRM